MTRSRSAFSILPLCAVLAAFLLAAAPAHASAIDFRVDDRALHLAAVPGDPGSSVSGVPVAEPRMHAMAPVGGTPSPLVAAGKSLLVPGWGQLATGHRTQAGVFAGLEFATWVSFGTFRREGALRRDSYFDTARLFAGIDLRGKSEDYRRFVGQYQSSDVYNQYVVLREAAYFFDDPTVRAQFIASHYITPENAWSWDSFDAFEVYRAQRRSSEQAFQRARYTLGFAVVNRLVSALAAARQASAQQKAARATNQLGGTPGQPRAALAVDVAPGPGLVPDARLACVVHF